MKKMACIATLLIALMLVLLSQLGCQPAADTNRPVAEPNTNSERAVVDTAAIEAEIRRIENDWPRVVKERDVETIKRVEADDVIMIYPDGNVGDKSQDLKDIESGALTAESWEIADLKIK